MASVVAVGREVVQPRRKIEVHDAQAEGLSRAFVFREKDPPLRKSFNATSDSNCSKRASIKILRD